VPFSSRAGLLLAIRDVTRLAEMTRHFILMLRFFLPMPSDELRDYAAHMLTMMMPTPCFFDPMLPPRPPRLFSLLASRDAAYCRLICWRYVNAP
jgi:hypothetical protein